MSTLSSCLSFTRMTDTNPTIKQINDIVAVAIKYHDEVKEDHTLGETFYKAGRRLGLIKEVLGHFQTQQPTDTEIKAEMPKSYWRYTDLT